MRRPRDSPRWTLDDLYHGPGDPRIEADLTDAERAAAAFESRHRGRIASGALRGSSLAECLAEYERILELASKPAFFGSLLVAADTGDAAARTLEERAEERAIRIRNQLLFLTLEVRDLDDDAFTGLVSNPALASYRHALSTERAMRPHTLTEPEERLLNRKAPTSRHAVVELFDELTASWAFPLEIDGEVRSLSEEEVLSFLRHPNRDLRDRAFDAFLARFRENQVALVSIYNAVLLDHRIDGELRRFATPSAERHLANEVRPETVETMMSAIDEENGLAREYFDLKRRILGLSSFRLSDVYAPVGGESPEISFAGARRLVLEAFEGFSGEIAEIAREFFDEGWIDAEVRPRKRSGAFCAAHSPKGHPYVFTSHTGTTRDVATLAHELGHGIHAQLSRGQSYWNFDTPLVLAETASVFAEMILIDHELRVSASPQTRTRILCELLDEIYGTLFRQNALTRFEIAAHDARREGRLDAETLSRLWLASQERLFGDAIELPEGYGIAWSVIPHFLHTPFYCYAYSFGELLVLGLYERYREEGPSFVPKYRRLLESGGSDSPAALLRPLDVDLDDPGFWKAGLRTVRRLLDELSDVVSSESARIVG